VTEEEAAGTTSSKEGGSLTEFGADDEVDSDSANFSPSPPRCRQFPGGVFLDSGVEYKDASPEVIRALRRLIAPVVAVHGDESPRIHPRKFVRRLAERSGRINRARRSEMDLPRVVVAADVSGSCSAAAGGTWSACLHLARKNERILVVEHSNGFPVACYSLETGWVRIEEIDGKLAWWIWLISRHDIHAIVAFGDWDAEDVYEMLSRRDINVYWLDSYSATWGPRPAARSIRPRDWTPAGHWQGINSGSGAAIALRAMGRKK
jgi:hypothetical protein